MREQEMRSALGQLLAELERRGRPLLLGAGLALAGPDLGCAALQATPTDGNLARDAGAERDLPTAVAMYSAPGCSAAPFFR